MSALGDFSVSMTLHIRAVQAPSWSGGWQLDIFCLPAIYDFYTAKLVLDLVTTSDGALIAEPSPNHSIQRTGGCRVSLSRQCRCVAHGFFPSLMSALCPTLFKL